jgi:universal stress protein E
VFHAIEYPELDYALPARVAFEDAVGRRQAAERHIAKQLAGYELARPAQINIVTEPPDFAILDHVERHGIELLVMGTIGRGGIAGMITGNTAERLLPRVSCSLLAVKPDDFRSPVTIE